MNPSEWPKAANAKQEVWLTQAIQELKQPVAPAIAAQLRAARRQALQPVKPRVSPWVWMGGAAVLASVMAVVMTQGLLPNPKPLPATLAQTAITPTDLPLLLGQDELQFYQDMEFIVWLDKEKKSEHKS